MTAGRGKARGEAAQFFWKYLMTWIKGIKARPIDKQIGGLNLDPNFDHYTNAWDNSLDSKYLSQDYVLKI